MLGQEIKGVDISAIVLMIEGSSLKGLHRCRTGDAAH